MLTTSKDNEVISIQLSYLILCAVLLLPGTLLAEAYKWVDESGKVHYTQQKPTDTTTEGTPEKHSIETLEAPPPVPTAVDDSNPESEQQTEDETTQADKEQRAADKAKYDEAVNKNCAAAKRNFRLTQSARRISYRDENNKRVPIDDAERTKRADEARKNIKQFCK